MKRLSCLTRVGQHQSFSPLLVSLGMVVALTAGYSVRAQQPTSQPATQKAAPASSPAQPSASPQATPLPQSTPFAVPSPSVAAPSPGASSTPPPQASPSPFVSLTIQNAQGLGLLTLDEALRRANALASSFQQAGINEKIAVEDVRQAQAAFLPRVSAPWKPAQRTS